MDICNTLAELRAAFDLAICELELRVDRAFPSRMKLF